MNKTVVYKISNAWIWVYSLIPVSILPLLWKNIQISEFDIFDWILFAAIFLTLPVIALLYRSKVIIRDRTFEIYRGTICEKWISKSTPYVFSKIGYPENDANGRLSFILENGKEVIFSPEKSLRDTFIRRKIK
jgi:hypothetical protein